jgi:hypothetical protein
MLLPLGHYTFPLILFGKELAPSIIAAAFFGPKHGTPCLKKNPLYRQK